LAHFAITWHTWRLKNYKFNKNKSLAILHFSYSIGHKKLGALRDNLARLAVKKLQIQ